MEAKLNAYRAKKRREHLLDRIKKQFKNLFTIKRPTKMIKLEIEEHAQSKQLLNEKEQLENDAYLSPIDSEEEEDDVSIRCCSYPTLIYYSLCFILWIITYTIFIKLQFGTVFLVVSAVLGMYFNTRTGPKRRGEVSAYSVFNKNCESIDGTLKAEQFEREIRYGPSSVR